MAARVYKRTPEQVVARKHRAAQRYQEKKQDRAWCVVQREKDRRYRNDPKNAAVMLKVKATSRLRYAERRAKKQALKDEAKARPCADCGTRFDPFVMDFHHVGEKRFAIAESDQWSIEEVQEEISRCVVLCSNCHRMRHKPK